MSHYKPYSAYRDSGVEWIGQVPKHWDMRRFKHLIEGPLQYGANETGDSSIEEGPRYIRITDLDDAGELRNNSVKRLSADIAQPYMLKDGDILFARSGATVGKTYQYRREHGPACFAGYLIRARLDRKIVHPDFVLLAVRSHYYWSYIQRTAIQATIENVGAERYGDFPVAIPSGDEQKRIVKSLDRETSRIDALITKKTRFIELLQEKRHALIDHSVTKGLDDDVPMRDSGVEWIGETPAHWLVAQLGKISIARCDGPFGSGLKSEHYQPEGVRVVRLQNIGWASFKDGNEAFISYQHWHDVLGCGHEVLPNDVLIGGLGDDKNPLGRACVAPANLGPAIVKADCYRFRLDTNRAMPEFIALALSATARSECGYLATGATRDRLNLGLASARVVALPPLNEQLEIVASLDRDTARIEFLTDKTQRSIDLLKERRAAFITAAVTGQIDLREFA